MATVRSRWTTFNVWRKGLRTELQGSTHHRAEDICLIFSFLAGLRTVFPQLGALVPPASRADHGPARKPNTNRSPPSFYSTDDRSKGLVLQLWHYALPARLKDLERSGNFLLVHTLIDICMCECVCACVRE